MSKTERTKPLNQCHNPADGGCKNPCEPGMNFCPDCMKAYGMKGNRTAPVSGRYRHPIIGVGDAAQTHLRPQENEPMDEVKNTYQITDKNNAVSQSLKKRYADSPREGVFFDGFVREWINCEAKTAGVTFQQYVRYLIMERIPADVVKAGMLTELQRKG